MSLTLNNGFKFPQIGLGTWKSQPGEVTAAVKHALKVGYRHIDAAHIYQNEHEVGEGLKQGMAEVGLQRQDVFVTSKLWNNSHHPDDVEPAFMKTLNALGLDYLDLYLIHWPTAFKRGDDLFPRNEDGSLQYEGGIPLIDTWKAMEKLVEKGLVKSIGVSNFNSKQIQGILDEGKIRPVTNQVECHPYLNQSKLIEFCKERDICITGYSPLGSPDRPWAQPDDPKLLEDPKILAVAEKYGKSAAQIVLRWQIQRGVVVIPKSVTPSRIEENFSITDFTLADEEMKLLDSFDCNGRIVVPMIDGKPRDGAHPDYPFHIEF